MVDAYKTLITKMATKLTKENVKDANVAKLIKERVEEIFDFEGKLALSISDIDEEDIESQYNRWTLKELSQLTPNSIDWTRLLNRLNQLIGNKKIQLKDSDAVIVTDVQFFKRVVPLILATPEYVIENYLGWAVVNEYSTLLNEALYDIDFEFSKLVYGVSQKRPIDQRCYGQANGLLSWALSRIYIDQDRAHSVHTKKQAELLVQELQDSFRELIKENTWLDVQTKAKALEKLNKMIKNVAYPDWILDDRKLDHFFAITNETAQTGKYFDSIVALRQLNQAATFRDLPNPVDPTTSWAMEPAIVNAAFIPTQNSITVPLGILVPPFFQPRLPDDLNFGGIGVVIGHEMTHSFDNSGRKFSATGILENWWTNATLQKFLNRTQCFIEQYGRIVDPTTKLNVRTCLEVTMF